MIPADLERMWRAALDRWSRSIALALPRAIEEMNGAIAYIDLATRQTHVNFGRLAKMGVEEHVPCVLAHEVGHHIRYPHTVAESRRMLRFLREVAAEVLWSGAPRPKPDADDWLLNLFFDLLINDELSSDYEASFIAIFRAMQGDWGLTFSFYITVFEELWALPAGAIVTPEQEAAMHAIDPNFRARAASTGEFLRGHPENRPLQLVRFLVAIRPFVVADRESGREAGEAFENEPLGGGSSPDADGVADLLRRRIDEDDARRWLREQGLGPQQDKPKPRAAEATGGNPLVRAQLQLQGLAPPQQIALAAYRAEADKARLEIPASFQPGEPFVPGPHTAWDLGDDLDTVDWIGSLARSGARPIPGVTTLSRTHLPDDPRPGDREAPWIELYIDSSGSMPNPQESYSHQIEAGFVLVRSAVRAGGRVRVIQYSSASQCIVMKEFTRSTLPAEMALLEYIGGGTDFPWDELIASTRRYKHLSRVRRVVISDSDFLANFSSPTPACDASQAIADAARAGGMTGLLAISGGDEMLVRAGMEVVRVADWSSIGQAARALADALFRVKEKTRTA
jgi:hypothetical protein